MLSIRTLVVSVVAHIIGLVIGFVSFPILVTAIVQSPYSTPSKTKMLRMMIDDLETELYRPDLDEVDQTISDL